MALTLFGERISRSLYSTSWKVRIEKNVGEVKLEVLTVVFFFFL